MPGHLYVGRLKGVGAVWQFTAVDVATRWAIAQLVVGDKKARAAAGFLDHLHRAFADLGVPVETVLTDNGPEFTGRVFTDNAHALGIDHVRIPPRSPNHNAVCERFQGTALHEFYRRLFDRVRVDRVADLDAALQHWLTPTTPDAATAATTCPAAPLDALNQLRDRIPA